MHRVLAGCSEAREAVRLPCWLPRCLGCAELGCYCDLWGSYPCLWIFAAVSHGATTAYTKGIAWCLSFLEPGPCTKGRGVGTPVAYDQPYLEVLQIATFNFFGWAWFGLTRPGRQVPANQFCSFLISCWSGIPLKH